MAPPDRSRPGGSLALAELIDTYGAGPIDYDLRTLGVDLVDVIDGRFPVARALWLLEQLGEGSATAAAIAGGPEHRPWTLANILSAAALHDLRQANWQRGGGKGSRPTPIQPPTRRRATRVAGHAASPARSKPQRVPSERGDQPRGEQARRNPLAMRAARRGAMRPRSTPAALPPGTT